MAETILQARASSTGSSRGGGASSLSALLSTLIPVLIVAGAIFTVFLICQKKHERVYGPRTFLPSLRRWQFAPKRTAGTFGWRREYSMLRDEFTLGHSSIDNYLWLRFFKTLTLMCFVGACITWPILFPVNATGGNGETFFNILSYTNVKPGPRYYAEAFVAWAFLAFVMFLITRESHFYLRLRQLYFLTPFESSRISNRTVLFTNIPEESRNEESMRTTFAGVRKVWLINVPTDLADNADARDKAAGKLDSGETKLIKGYVKAQLKKEKKAAKEAKKKDEPAPVAPEALEAGRQGGQAPVVIDKKDRPTHRLPVAKILPLGKKVDTIDWSRGELRRLIPLVAQEQQAHKEGRSPPQSAAFVEFDSVESAHHAVQQLSSTKKAQMIPKVQGIAPDEVIWKNTIKAPSKIRLFKGVSTAFVWWLCIFWTIPVAVIGAISNINYLTNKVPFLKFINDIPPVVLGVVTGLLPVVLLAVLMALVPIIMGILAGFFEPTRGTQQLRVQSWYFPFQVIQVFVITTFASAASSVVTQIIKNPAIATTLLAENLPKASNFYIAYFVLYGLQPTAMMFLNIAPLLFMTVLGGIFDGTPRKMFKRYVNLGGVGWGSSYPVYTNLGVIALSYSCIAPLILGFATVAFALLTLGVRYNVLFVLGTTYTTGGESYARAIKQLTVGLYLSEVCLLGLFAISVNSSKQSIGPLVLMIIFLVATVLWHLWLNRSLRKMSDSLPASEIPEKTTYGRDNSDVEMHPGYNNGTSNGASNGASNGYDDNEKHLPPTTVVSPNEQGQQGFKEKFMAFFHPQADAARVMRMLSPHLSEPIRPYTQREYEEAYLPPAVTSECPMVWIPRDKYGVSTQEVAGSREAIGQEGFEITDEGAWFNEKGKLQFGSDNISGMPIYEEKPIY